MSTRPSLVRRGSPPKRCKDQSSTTCRKGSPTPRQGRDQRQAASPILCANAILAPNRRRGRQRRGHHGNRDQSRLHGSPGRRERCQAQHHGSRRQSLLHGSPVRPTTAAANRCSAETSTDRCSAEAAAYRAPTEAAALSKSPAREQRRHEQGSRSNKPKLFHGRLLRASASLNI